MNTTIEKMNLHKSISKKLVGKTIKSVFFLDRKTADELGIMSLPLVIRFTDGSLIFPMADAEGNDGGALFTTIEGIETIGTL